MISKYLGTHESQEEITFKALEEHEPMSTQGRSDNKWLFQKRCIRAAPNEHARTKNETKLKLSLVGMCNIES